MTTISNDPTQQPHLYIDWQIFDRAIEMLSVRIHDAMLRLPQKSFDTAIWVVPTISAMPVATALIHRLKLTYGVNIDKSTLAVYDVDRRPDITSQLLQRRPSTIVYVDDIIDTGQSFNRFADIVTASQQPTDILIATLVNRATTVQIPIDNLCAGITIVDKTDYIVFPWEYLDNC